MPINFDAGKKELAESGNIVEKGFGQLTQQRMQFGQQMAQQIRQNKQDKAQQNQQMFDSAIGAVNMFANIQQKNAELERQKAADADRKVQMDWMKQDRDRQQVALKSEDKVLAQEYKAQNAMTMTGKDFSGTDEELANNIRVSKKLEAEKMQVAAQALNVKKVEADIAHMATADKLDAKKVAQKDEEIAQNAEMMARNDLKARETNFKTAMASRSDPNFAYDSQPKETKARHLGGLKELDSKVAKIQANKRVIGDTYELFDAKPSKDGKLDEQELNKVKDGFKTITPNDPKYFRLVKMAATYAMSGMKQMRETQGGNLSNLDVQKSGEVSGANALTDVQAKNWLDENVPLAAKLVNSLKTVITNGAGFEGLQMELDKENKRLTEEAQTSVIANGGFSSLPPGERAEVYWKAMPDEQKQTMNFEEFTQLPTNQQAKMSVGVNENLDFWSRANDFDNRAKNPHAVIERLAKDEQQKSLFIPGLKRDRADALMKQHNMTITLLADSMKPKPVTPAAPARNAPVTATAVLTTDGTGGFTQSTNSAGMAHDIPSPFSYSQPWSGQQQPQAQASIKQPAIPRKPVVLNSFK